MRAELRKAALPLLTLLTALSTAPRLSGQASPAAPRHAARPGAPAPAAGSGAWVRARPEDVGMSSARLARLTSTFDKYVADGRLAGAVVLVARHGKVAYVHAFGQRDREAASPMPENAIFRIASQSKAVVSVATMVLQEEGALLITDPVSKYIPEFAKTTVAVPVDSARVDIVPAKRAITIRDLLTHTSGVSYGYGPAAARWKAAGIQGWYFADRDEPVGATVARMAALPFDAQPGERFIYGYNIDILGAVLEKAAGMPLDQLLQAKVLGPLKMNDTHFYVPVADRDRFAAVYSVRNGSLVRAPAEGTMESQGQYVDGPRKSFSGGAGLTSTASDYARFLQMLLNGGELDGVRVLSPKTVQLMTADHVGARYTSPAGAGFGLGFEVVKDLGAYGQPASEGEYGWGGAYHSTYWVDPREDLVVVYFTQVIPATGLDDMGKLRALVYGSIVDGGRR